MPNQGAQNQFSNGQYANLNQLPLENILEEAFKAKFDANSIPLDSNGSATRMMSWRPTFNEIFILTFMVLAAMIKLVFGVMIIKFVLFSDTTQMDHHFDASQYVPHASFFMLIAIASAVNTMLLITSRLEENFFERPEVLSCHIVLDAFSISLHFAVYLLYHCDMTNDALSQSIGTVVRLILIMDFIKSCMLVIFDWALKNELMRHTEGDTQSID